MNIYLGKGWEMSREMGVGSEYKFLDSSPPLIFDPLLKSHSTLYLFPDSGLLERKFKEAEGGRSPF